MGLLARSLFIDLRHLGFMLAARARGLGTAWTTLHLVHEKEIAGLLGIPFEQVMQVALIPVAHVSEPFGMPAPAQTRCSTWTAVKHAALGLAALLAAAPAGARAPRRLVLMLASTSSGRILTLPGGLGRLAREGRVFSDAALAHGMTETCPTRPC
jgi:hypothetical protein